MTNYGTPLTRSQLRLVAPSIFADSPYTSRSERYRFIPTTEVLDALEGQGFFPVRAVQSCSRIPGKRNYTRHMIRFRQKDDFFIPDQKAEIPEIVLINSHDGTSAYKFLSGIFRMVCSNGMIVQSEDFGSVSVRHMGGKDSKEFHDRVIGATFQVLDDAGNAVNRINEWKSIPLTDSQRMAFATAALELKPSPITPEQLLIPRRIEDQKTDLWTTVSVVQEHMLKGGDSGRTGTGRRTRTRTVRAVQEDVRLNRAIWVLAENLAKAVV